MVQIFGRISPFIRWVHSLGSIEEQNKFTPAYVPRRQFVVCIMEAVVSYKIQCSFTRLAIKAILVIFVKTSSSSDSDTVVSWARTRLDSIVNWKVGKRWNSPRYDGSSLQANSPLKTGSALLGVVVRNGAANCTRLRRVQLLRVLVQVSFCVRSFWAGAGLRWFWETCVVQPDKEECGCPHLLERLSLLLSCLFMYVDQWFWFFDFFGPNSRQFCKGEIR